MTGKVGLVATLIAPLAGTLLPARMAYATSTTTLKAEAADIVSKIAALKSQFEVENEQYNQVNVHLAQTNQQLSANQNKLIQDRRQVAKETSDLSQEVINAFIQGGTSTTSGITSTSNAEQATLRQEFMQVTTGSMNNSIAQLGQARRALNSAQQELQATKQAQQSEEANLKNMMAAGQANIANQRALLAGINQKLANLVNQITAQKTQQAQAAGQSRWASQILAPANPTALGPDTQGLIALRAAESQIGVPYVWGGATPGVGFDCSGLTMWSWAQAGVSLPHSAAMQYADITHISMSELQPGDLLFYSYGGYIGHVTMYVGPGQMIQAENTGTNVMITSIWYSNLVGAGRP
ncbi:MAG: NlpC/P60 family protein [Actinobacteria bacterium]|nr:NlpC/P60 family protein [Actinomycetota bacterium]MCL6105434.1 NlpC/P60 family protein [Actinomycetota bacterium]